MACALVIRILQAFGFLAAVVHLLAAAQHQNVVGDLTAANVNVDQVYDLALVQSSVKVLLTTQGDVADRHSPISEAQPVSRAQAEHVNGVVKSGWRNVERGFALLLIGTKKAIAAMRDQRPDRGLAFWCILFTGSAVLLWVCIAVVVCLLMEPGPGLQQGYQSGGGRVLCRFVAAPLRCGCCHDRAHKTTILYKKGSESNLSSPKGRFTGITLDEAIMSSPKSPSTSPRSSPKSNRFYSR